MKNIVLCAAFLCAVLLTGCGAKDSQTIAVCREHAAALRKGDFALAASMCTGERAEFFARVSSTLNEAYSSGDHWNEEAAHFVDGMFRNYKYEFKGEVVDGGEARVTVVETCISSGKTRDLYWLLRKVGADEWKIYDSKEIYTGGDGIEAKNKDEVEKYYLPKPVTLYISGEFGNIAPDAFSGCTAIGGDLMIPKGIEVGPRAFKGTNIRSVEIGEEKIGAYAFADCKNLEKVVLPKGMTEIPKGLFKGCDKLREITIPKETFAVGDEAFYDCSSLNITIPENIWSFGDKSFAGCGKISVNPGHRFSKVGQQAFLNSHLEIDKLVTSPWADFKPYALNGVKIRKAVIRVGERAPREIAIKEGIFGGCDIEKLVIDEGITEIGKDAFGGCSVEEILIPQSVTKIGEGAFRGANIKKILIPEGVKTIEPYAFYGCRQLKTVLLPEGLRAIEKEAFKDCTALENIKIPSSVYEIGKDAFQECKALKSVTVSCSTISNGAFSDCTALEKVTLLNGVEEIENDAFRNCTALKEITFPPSLKRTDSGTFEDSGLKRVKAPKGRYYIGVPRGCIIEEY